MKEMIFNKNNNSRLIEDIYQNIIERSRSKYFYLDKEVNDIFESRFDLIIFHSFMIFHFFREMNINNNPIPQNLFDFMFKDFENNLREMGFGDVAVNKKMKVFISAFYGRISNYSIGVELYRVEGNKRKLSEAIKNNIYKNEKVSSKSVDFFVEYLLLNLDVFMKNSLEANIAERFDFICPEHINR
tara:strand:- start:35 stop:592 length:558 start_codon:yes stop_codon:yes gene_type:complete